MDRYALNPLLRMLAFASLALATPADADVAQGATRGQFSEGQRLTYTRLLTRGATAGLFVDHGVRYLTKRGFRVVDLDDAATRDARFSPGDRLAFVNRGRGLLLVIVGTAPLTQGARLIGAHIDAPQLRVAVDAVTEVDGFAALRGAPQGGIKDYQWESRPLLLVGHVFTRGGVRKTLEVDASAPRFIVAPRLARSGGKAAPPGRLGQRSPTMLALAASVPKLPQGGKVAALSHTFLTALHTRYGITRDDLRTADLALVPALAPVSVGLDGGLIAGYGQDDRACAIPSMMALADLEPGRPPARTAIALLVDKEELGSTGTTGAQSAFVDRVLAALLRRLGLASSAQALRETWARTEALSADVTAGVNPLFPHVHELANAARLGRGLAITKYTGYGGKLGASEADTEWVARLTARLARAHVVMQVGLIGRVNEGGGGTIAQHLAHRGMQVLDVGVPVLSMHSPFEVADWRDLRAMYDGARAFWIEP